MFEKMKTSFLHRWRGARPEQQAADLERRAARLHRQADEMMQLGRHTEALQRYQEALDAARELARTHPRDHIHIEAIASMLYSMASALTALGQPAAAIAALEESEQHYRALGAARVRPVDGLVADVQARRGFAQHARGYGTSAVLDLDAAVVAYRCLYSGRDNDPHALDLARVLAMNAAVLRAYGDPDLAVAAADAALRLYLSKASTVNRTPAVALHTTYTLMAASVASEIHAAHRRMDLAYAADEIAAHTARLLQPRNTVQARQELARALGRKGLHLRATNRPTEAEPLFNEGRKLDSAAAQQAVAQWEQVQAGAAPAQVTVATALAVAAKELGTERVPAELAASLTRPARDVALLSPFDRCSPQQTHAYAQQLAEISIALLPAKRVEGLRLGLETHYLFAIASREQTLAMRYQLNVYGPPWARTLLACSQAYEAEGQLNMALDLAAWGGGVVQKFLPFRILDTELRPLIRECVEQHGRLCIATGDTRVGEEILHQAQTLWEN
jgi:tetratricopeptide (TPR) repeat protein